MLTSHPLAAHEPSRLSLSLSLTKARVSGWSQVEGTERGSGEVREDIGVRGFGESEMY